MEDEKLLLAEHKLFTDAFWKNEDIGEKRVEFFVTLTTAIIAGLVALITSKQSTMPYEILREISTGALISLLLFGLITLSRILQRNRVTDEYKGIVDYLRDQLKKRSSNLLNYELPFKVHKRLFTGGLAETVSLMNSIIFSIITALWVEEKIKLLGIILSFILSFILQISLSRKDRIAKPRSSHTQTFRAGVGAIISNSKGKVLTFERKDISGAWQLPQGGLEIGEEPLVAIKREIFEETGISENLLQLVSKDSLLLVYELPKEKQSFKTGRGQAQRWFHFHYNGADENITLGNKKEFRSWKWQSMNDLITSVVSFKKPVYKELAKHFLKHR
ncbi:MAG: RNA pyrophosphohydrolase [Anaerolineales bacterium]|nr:RNA pyrophosphohydrolase [Anaerolineales bacterium]